MNTNLGLFEWKLSKYEVQSKVDDSIEFKQNDGQPVQNPSFRSDEFTVNDTNFYLTCYINGYSEKNKGWVNLFLNLNKLPNQANGIYARISLHCNEMGTHFVTVHDFSMIFNDIGWTDHSLKSNDIQLYLNDKSKNDYITFQVKIEILKCYYSSSYIGNITYCHQFKMYQSINYKWHIYGYQLQSFQTATNGNRFCSDTFGDNQWYLEVYPNGSTKKEISNLICNIRSLQLPFNIHKIECNISLQCNLNNIHFETNYAFINTPHSGIGWKAGVINTKQLYNLQAKDIVTFSVHIQVIKIYDMNKSIINKQLWSDYIIDTVSHSNQPQCVHHNDEKTDSNKSHTMLMEVVNNIQNRESEYDSKYKHIMNKLHDNEMKKNDEYDMIIDLRKDLELLKKEFRNVQRLKRRNSEINGMDRNQVLQRNKKKNTFKQWLQSDDISMYEYYDLFAAEGIESLDVACKLTQQQLIEIGIIKYGHIQILSERFKQYREGVQVLEDDCEGAGYKENIALPDFNADVMPNAADCNDIKFKVNGADKNFKEEKKEVDGDEDNIMAFAALSDIILPVIKNDEIDNQEFVEENEIDGQSKSSKSNHVSKSSQSVSLDFVD